MNRLCTLVAILSSCQESLKPHAGCQSLMHAKFTTSHFVLGEPWLQAQILPLSMAQDLCKDI
jgi:hypothetical protein